MSSDVLTAPILVRDVFLKPGDFYFGPQNTRIRTLLGSCVSIIIWHPVLRVGGMCHYLLPSRGDRPQNSLANGKYGEEAIEMFLKEIQKTNSRPRDYTVKVFGGADMFQKNKNVHFVSRDEEEIVKKDGSAVGHKNIQFALLGLEQAGFSIQGKDIGGFHHRRIYFSVWDGEVWVESAD